MTPPGNLAIPSQPHGRPERPSFASGRYRTRTTPSCSSPTAATASPTKPWQPSASSLEVSLDATDRSVAPHKGFSTLGFDPTRLQTEPPACYRASWQLPGPDSHWQATTSIRPKVNYISSPPESAWRMNE
jgi:hypothetical protein